ncbi:MAG: DinB family protein [Candidatus Hydrogenedentes bacterium]|nr:DinB family protein [Candidatus Hydrogenedentota bacterium]
MNKKLLEYELRSTEAFCLHVASVFTDDEATYRPQESLMTVAQQLAHVAQTVDWFLEGASSPQGFNLDFESLAKEIQKVGALPDVKAWVKRSFESARGFLNELQETSLSDPLPPGPILGGIPKAAIFLGIIDHTAHHRGVLAMYARTSGKVPPMPYEAAPAWEK